MIHNAGHMVYGPAEAFYSSSSSGPLYDVVNAPETQRVNRAVLPHLRARRAGLRGVGVQQQLRGWHLSPYLAPYFAAKNGMDALALGYARELALWGIETSIIVPAHSPRARTTSPMPAPWPTRRSSTPTRPAPISFGPRVQEAFSSIVPPDADPAAVARAVVDVVAAPFERDRFGAYRPQR